MDFIGKTIKILLEWWFLHFIGFHGEIMVSFEVYSDSHSNYPAEILFPAPLSTFQVPIIFVTQTDV